MSNASGNSEAQKGETNKIVTNDFKTVLKAARSYNAIGYNILPILCKGAKYPKLTDGGVDIEIADGKSAAGFDRWTDWQEIKQTVEFVDTIEGQLQKLNAKLSLTRLIEMR
jgi:hypothetical protein